ncbi:LpxI family protein [Pseudohalocynthiibacter aestuariivivens]|jgi:UDP-2,3-diacylglucosamine hydrolase|uniref:LpxI family protein n=1 Tax=Pseudohalocynthiibacter aestuariivivens TaxID=1591409 RepID=A0ABV5JIA5_9RHOB|nr:MULTISPECIES: UDP-2,3-diacylglucosamine diphosphatase LpxI [Pseudohalocynthiibacter]MBS9716178.1 UDP-2,3-diacylglucosamine diphosphatase LpxI [Pseudohalocynthiibacter aestuariivivens]MCK0101014.1 UDP-2,3-diacylglucosamine diphosphatase LpxI [Pseudohalocynthiibacter sp. F2068]
MLAIIAGTGRLPGALSEKLTLAGKDYILCEIEGFEIENPCGAPVIRFRVEQLARFFATLKDKKVQEVVFAGAIHRPRIDPTAFDPETLKLAPKFLAAMQGGDDTILRVVLSLFEDAGFTIRAAHEVSPDLLPATGVLTNVVPDEKDTADAARAAEVTAALGAADVGQGCVVQQGLVLACETLPGTDWMLAQLANAPFLARPDRSKGAGVFFKAPKPDQDRRVDLPIVGPVTIDAVSAAGLGGLVLEAGGVMIMEADVAIEKANAAGLFIWVRDNTTETA